MSFLFLFTSSIALIDARSWLFFHVIYFIFGARPSWSSLQVQLNLIIFFRYFAPRLRGVYLCLMMVSSPTSAKIADAALWHLGAWRAPTVIAVWNIFKNSKWMKKINFSMNYYLNVSLIGSSTKNDRCQDVTKVSFLRFVYSIRSLFYQTI